MFSSRFEEPTERNTSNGTHVGSVHEPRSTSRNYGLLFGISQHF